MTDTTSGESTGLPTYGPAEDRAAILAVCRGDAEVARAVLLTLGVYRRQGAR